jgi:hypothetical protein
MFCDRALERLGLLQYAQYPYAKNISDHNVMGHLYRAKTLIVGEQLKPKEFHTKHNVFYPFYEYGNSSLYLNTILDKIKMVEEKVMWTNAINLSYISSPHIRSLYDAGVTNIIALGKVAETEVNKLHLPCTMVPHPQYAKRFNLQHYDKMLEEALCGRQTTS